MMSLNYTVNLEAIQQKIIEFFMSQRRNLMQTHLDIAVKVTEGMQKEVVHYKGFCEQTISELVGGAISESVWSLFN